MDDGWTGLPHPPAPVLEVVKRLPKAEILLTKPAIWIREAPWGEVAEEIPAPGNNLSVRVCDCRRVESERDLFGEFARALEFPSWFGWNWDALMDLLGDLDWISTDLIVVVRDEQLLRPALGDRAGLVIVSLYDIIHYGRMTAIEFGDGWRRAVIIQREVGP